MFDTAQIRQDRTHPNVPTVDQTDRRIPFNLRQSGTDAGSDAHFNTCA